MGKPTWYCSDNPAVLQVRCRCEKCAQAMRLRVAEANARKYVKHRDRYIAEQKAYQATNRDAISARRRASYAADPEPQKRRSSEYIAAQRAINPQKFRDRDREYKQANRSKVSAKERLRNARKAGNTPELLNVSEKDWRRLVARYVGCCAYCGKHAKMTQDHIIPISRGGRHSIGNLLPACRECNCSKHARLIIEWRANNRTKVREKVS